MGIVDKIRQIEQKIARTQKTKLHNIMLDNLKLSQLNIGHSYYNLLFQVKKDRDLKLIDLGMQSMYNRIFFCGQIYIIIIMMLKQLLDLPSIIEGASEGRDRQVIAVAKNSDMVLMVLYDTKAEQQKVKIFRRLEKVGIRLNKPPASIQITPTKFGGVKLNSTKAITHLNQKVVKNTLAEYKIHNANVLIFDDNIIDDNIIDDNIIDDNIIDDLIDVVEGNRKYFNCLYCYNKIDTISLDEVNILAMQPNSVVISYNLKLNFDGLLQKIWEKLDLVRVYSKKPNQNLDFSHPIVLTNDRNGFTVKNFCQQIHRDLKKQFKYAKVWQELINIGQSCKFIPQKVGVNHVLADKNVLKIYINKTKQAIKKERPSQDNQTAKKVQPKKQKKMIIIFKYQILNIYDLSILYEQLFILCLLQYIKLLISFSQKIVPHL